MNRLSMWIGLVCLIAVVGCGSADVQQDAEGEGASAEGEVQPYEDFDPNNFSNPTQINNEWFPLVPGTRWVYEGQTIDEGEAIPHRVIFTVTDLVKEIDGIPTIVVWDQDFEDDELVETEIAFFAQDDDGNVWHFGQYPEEYEEGEFVIAPGWIAGVKDARAGIHIKGTPDQNAGSYAQGWAPSVNWTDRTQVYQMGQETCVPVGCYEDVLVMDEFSQEEPGAFQLKYYAPGVGYVRVGFRGDDPSQEELELIEYRQLDASEMDAVREEVMALDQAAYERMADFYADTPPVQLRE